MESIPTLISGILSIISAALLLKKARLEAKEIIERHDNKKTKTGKTHKKIKLADVLMILFALFTLSLSFFIPEPIKALDVIMISMVVSSLMVYIFEILGRYTKSE